MCPRRKRHIGPVSDPIEKPMADDRGEQDQGAPPVPLRKKVGCCEQRSPEKIHKKAVAQPDVESEEVVRRTLARLELDLLKPHDHENGPENVGKYSCQDACSKREPRLSPLGEKSYREVSNENSVS